MPSRLVILAEEVLFQGGAEAPGRAGFDALARLQLVAFFHRPRRDDGLASVLGEVTDRWRVDPAQLHGVFGRLDDLACVAACGATAVALTELLEPQADLPPKTWVHDDLTAFVDALLEEPDEET